MYGFEVWLPKTKDMRKLNIWEWQLQKIYDPKTGGDKSTTRSYMRIWEILQWNRLDIICEMCGRGLIFIR